MKQKKWYIWIAPATETMNSVFVALLFTTHRFVIFPFFFGIFNKPSAHCCEKVARLYDDWLITWACAATFFWTLFFGHVTKILALIDQILDPTGEKTSFVVWKGCISHLRCPTSLRQKFHAVITPSMFDTCRTATHTGFPIKVQFGSTCLIWQKLWLINFESLNLKLWFVVTVCANS